MKTWLTRTEASTLLGVRAQTLYAYASRGQVQVRSDPDAPRRSLYRAEDVAELVRRRERGKRPGAVAASTIAWGEPIIETSISTIVRGQLLYRGYDAVGLASSATLEDAARLLWGTPTCPEFVTRCTDFGDGTPAEKALVSVARASATGAPIAGRAGAALVSEAAEIVGRLAGAFGVTGDGRGALHERVSAAWHLGPRATDVVRRALVLLADQELTSSAFAARVCASTGASLASCVLGGLAALSGPRHGGAPTRVRALFDEVARAGVDDVVQRHLRCGLAIPGFGHPLYPEGDPRASALLGSFDPTPDFSSTIERVLAVTGLAPTVDVALVALAKRFDLPEHGPFALFATARSVGWLAHGMEQSASDALIRPRARYVGPTRE